MSKNKQKALALRKSIADRKHDKKLKKYKVTMVREVEYHANVEVEAESADVAKQMAENIADGGRGYWVEGDCIAHTAKAEVIE